MWVWLIVGFIALLFALGYKLEKATEFYKEGQAPPREGWFEREAKRQYDEEFAKGKIPTPELYRYLKHHNLLGNYKTPIEIARAEMQFKNWQTSGGANPFLKSNPFESPKAANYYGIIPNSERELISFLSRNHPDWQILTADDYSKAKALHQEWLANQVPYKKPPQPKKEKILGIEIDADFNDKHWIPRNDRDGGWLPTAKFAWEANEEYENSKQKPNAPKPLKKATISQRASVKKSPYVNSGKGDKYRGAQNDYRWFEGETGMGAKFEYIDKDGVFTEREVVNWVSTGPHINAFCLSRHENRTFLKSGIFNWNAD